MQFSGERKRDPREGEFKREEFLKGQLERGEVKSAENFREQLESDFKGVS